MRVGLLMMLLMLSGSVQRSLLGQSPAPWLGTWKLNIERSPESANARQYKRVTTRIEPWGDGIKVVYDMVGKRGGVTHIEWQGKLDGQDYPMQGVDNFLTNAYSLVSDHSYRIEIKMDRNLAAVTLVDVSADGQTLTATTTERTAQGQDRQTTAVYERVQN